MPVDIFTAAAALAEAGPLAAEALAVEAVSPAAFLAGARAGRGALPPPPCVLLAFWWGEEA